MWTLQDLPLRKQTCSLPMSFSRVAVKRSSMTLPNTLLVRLKRAVPLQLLQSDKSPFFASVTIRPVFQSSGMFSEVQISQKSFERMVSARDSFACSSSALVPSAPGALSFFILLMAFLISWIDGGSVFMSMT